MANFVELFQTLRQITITKTQILQQVIENKQKIDNLLTQNEKYLKSNQLHYLNDTSSSIDHNLNKQFKIRTKDEKQKHVELSAFEKLFTALNVLRKQQAECRQTKNKRVHERLQLINRIKQQQKKLQELPYQFNPCSNSISHSQRSSGNVRQLKQIENQIKFRQAYTQRQVNYQQNKALICQLFQLQKTKKVKQHQLLDIQVKCQQEMQMISRLKQGYDRIQQQIPMLKGNISEISKKVSKYEFEYQKLEISNNKLKRQMFRNKQECNIRGLQQKIKDQKQINSHLQELYKNQLETQQMYLEVISNIKKQLQI